MKTFRTCLTALVLPTAAAFSSVAHAYDALPGYLVPTAKLMAPLLLKDAPAQWDAILKDYPSARFRDVRMHHTYKPFIWFLCGEVKSKNGFGGYGDWEGFAISAKGISLDLSQGTADEYTELCSSMAKPSQVDDVDDFSQSLLYQPPK